MNHAALVSVGIAALTFAKTDEELDRWLKDNMPWIRTIRARAPEEYDRLVAAGKAHRARLAPPGPISRTASCTPS
jgi:predicted phosphoadenosine phosphosulfate sulfurtransferase